MIVFRCIYFIYVFCLQFSFRSTNLRNINLFLCEKIFEERKTAEELKAAKKATKNENITREEKVIKEDKLSKNKNVVEENSSKVSRKIIINLWRISRKK